MPLFVKDKQGICLECNNISWKTGIMCISTSLLSKKERSQAKLLPLQRIDVGVRPYAPWQRAQPHHSAENQLEMQGCVALQHFRCQNARSGCTFMFVKHKSSREHGHWSYLCWCRSATHWLIAQVLFPPSWGRGPPGTYLTTNQQTARSFNCLASWFKDKSCTEHLKADFFASEHQQKPANTLKSF